jgi:predicted LPLAT superfamily acyltransferase
MSAPATAGLDKVPAWKRAAERSNARTMRFMAWLSLRIGRRCSRAIVIGIAAYFWVFGGSARWASRQYLARVLGRPPSARDTFRHVLCFATVTHDRIFFLKSRFALFDIDIHGAEEFMRDRERGLALLLMGGHLGSFEALRAVGERTGRLPVSMLMYADNAAMLNATLSALQPDPAPRVISLQRADAMLAAQQDLEAGRVIGLLADRRLANEPADAYPFLGAPALFPRNPHRLADILKCKVYFMAALHMGGSRYGVHLRPLADFTQPLPPASSREQRAQRIATAQAAYVAALEDMTNQAPFNWFNFFDFWGDTAGPDERPGERIGGAQ